MRLAIFQVFPLDFVGMLEISKKVICALVRQFCSISSEQIHGYKGLCYVQVFGKTAVDVLLSQGVLAISHSSKHVKLYSFEYILNKVMPK